VSVPSRLPKTICAPWLRAGSTERKYVAASGGRFGVFPSIMSPTAGMVTEAAGAFRGAPVAAGGGVRVAAGRAGGGKAGGAGGGIAAGAGREDQHGERADARAERSRQPGRPPLTHAPQLSGSWARKVR